MTSRLFLPLLAFLALWSATAAAQPVLDVPVACRIRQDCFLQNYVDVDPSGEFKDFTCGTLGYNEHNGTDFRVPTMKELRRGVDVLAAADGVVVRARDGVADTGLPKEGAAALGGQMAGNAIVIDHGDNWETQYNHLRLGSQIVKPGDRVKAGQKLALMGFSGNTVFPHLDMSVRHKGKVVDPFVGEVDAGWQCGGPRKPLWSRNAERLLAYHPSDMLAVGFAAEEATMPKILDGAYSATQLIDPPIVAVWGLMYGGKAGDRVRVEMRDPDGKPVTVSESTIDRPLAQFFRLAGQRRPRNGWIAGRYRGSVNLVRDGRVVAHGETTIDVRAQAPGPP